MQHGQSRTRANVAVTASAKVTLIGRQHRLSTRTVRIVTGLAFVSRRGVNDVGPARDGIFVTGHAQISRASRQESRLVGLVSHVAIRTFLGREVGNACEMVESVDVLRGRGPRDLTEVTFRLGEEMLLMGGITHDRADARRRLEHAVDSGAALEKLAEVAEAQGGDPGVIHCCGAGGGGGAAGRIRFNQESVTLTESSTISPIGDQGGIVGRW